MNTQTYCNFYVGATKHLEPDKKLSQGLCVLLLKIKQASLKWSHGAKELRGGVRDPNQLPGFGSSEMLHLVS